MSVINVHIAHEYEINQVPRTILYTTGVTTFTHTQLVMIKYLWVYVYFKSTYSDG